MQAFNYIALDASGKTKKGTIAADGEPDARQRLKARKLYATTISLAKERRPSASTGKLAKFLERREKISSKDLALLTRQLATMVQAASPVEEALAALAQQVEKPAARGVLTRVRASVMEGMRLSQAMEQEPDTFDDLYCSMVAAGEASGDLGGVLARVAEHREKSEETRSKVQSALIYPAVLFVVAISVVTALMVFVVPKVVAQFESFGSELPTLTKLVVATSEFVTNYGLYMLAAIVLSVIVFRFFLRRPAVKLAVHGALLKLPLVGRLIRGVNGARFA